MPNQKSRSTSFPSLSLSTLGGLMVFILIIAVYLTGLRNVASGLSLTEFLIIFAVALLGYLGYIFVAGPIVTKLTHRCAADCHFEPFGKATGEPAEEFTSWVRSIVPQMESLGFTTLGHFRPSQTVPFARAFVSLFENRPARQTAQLFTVTAKLGIVRKSETVLSFTTDFTDGTTLRTGNSSTLAVQPQIRIREGTMSFPWIDDPRRLYAIHNASIAHYAGDGIRLDPVIEDPAEFLRTQHHQSTVKFAESGYYYLDEERQTYYPTWRGSILMAWKLIWPVKPIRQFMRRRRAAQILREIGFA